MDRVLSARWTLWAGSLFLLKRDACFNMREGDELTISVEGQSVKVEKLDATCTFCGSTERVRSFHGKGICASCTAELSDLSY